jgi:hypothetical protein
MDFLIHGFPFKFFKCFKKYIIWYYELVGNNDEFKSPCEMVKISQLWPIPPTPNIKHWVINGAMDVYYSNRWWVGIPVMASFWFLQ